MAKLSFGASAALENLFTASFSMQAADMGMNAFKSALPLTSIFESRAGIPTVKPEATFNFGFNL